MKIIADDNIPYVKEAFGDLGDITLVAGRQINSDTVTDADILLVRSVTRVDEKLLEKSRVKFVATATIGMDHIDTEYLGNRAITFAAAPGSNADSVAEYIVSALFALARKHRFQLSGRSIGVVGVGNVGSRVVKKTRSIGMTVLENDPPLAQTTGQNRFVPIEPILGCDFITFHVPLTMEGEHATHHMINRRLLDTANNNSFIINTSRGAVADTSALIEALSSGQIRGTVIDVWENEPQIDSELLRKSDLATPHIAGYSFDGKVNGTYMIYCAACKFLGIQPQWSPKNNMPPPPVPEIKIDSASETDETALEKIIHTIYDISEDDARLREMLNLPKQQRGSFFDRLRRNYPVRRGFHKTVVDSVGNHELACKASGLGFQIKES